MHSTWRSTKWYIKVIRLNANAYFIGIDNQQCNNCPTVLLILFTKVKFVFVINISVICTYWILLNSVTLSKRPNLSVHFEQLVKCGGFSTKDATNLSGLFVVTCFDDNFITPFSKADKKIAHKTPLHSNATSMFKV